MLEKVGERTVIVKSTDLPESRAESQCESWNNRRSQKRYMGGRKTGPELVPSCVMRTKLSCGSQIPFNQGNSNRLQP